MIVKPIDCFRSALLLATLLLAGTLAAATVQTRINVFEDTDSLSQLLGGALACELSEELMVDMPVLPIYTDGSGICEEIAGAALTDGRYFADANCQRPMPFRRTTQQAFCSGALDKLSLGDASDLRQTGDYWTLSPGNRFDVGAASLAGLTQPYMQRTTYKEVQTANGICDLEMRVYTNAPGDTGLKSMVAYHGGSWRARGFGFFGLEMSVAHFTNTGFVVFAPFYRLLDTKESSPACHGASIEQVAQDAADALQWVREHAADYGAADYPTVFGQSAGAHLATSVSVNQPASVANAILYYPPTDFTEFALRVQDGSYTNEEGLGILEVVLGGDASSVDVSASPVPENTFPSQVESNPELFPPMFMLHGLADELVEATQSTRLCAALGGNIDNSMDRVAWLQQPDLRHKVVCDQRGSEMHLIKEGDHALDVCISNNPFLQDLCLSGSSQSRTLVADSIASAVSWSATVADQRQALLANAGSGSTMDNEADGSNPDATATGTNEGSSGGGGGVMWLWLPFALLMLRLRGSWFSRGARALNPGK